MLVVISCHFEGSHMLALWDSRRVFGQEVLCSFMFFGGWVFSPVEVDGRPRRHVC